VLRITCEPPANGTRTMHLEGRLARRWVRELANLIEPLVAGGAPIRLDLSGLVFVDAAGIDLLQRLEARGVDLAGGSPFIATLIAPPAEPVR
jgi:ABC-type transporter Mla MlaB component